jgi:hypothetical protein
VFVCWIFQIEKGSFKLIVCNISLREGMLNESMFLVCFLCVNSLLSTFIMWIGCCTCEVSGVWWLFVFVKPI